MWYSKIEVGIGKSLKKAKGQEEEKEKKNQVVSPPEGKKITM